MNTRFLVENLPLAAIVVGERRREKLGPLGTLKRSLERVGQIHPITVRMNGSGYDLVAGERRLKAAEALGWKRIRARIGKFDDDELREIELDENAVRLDLTEFEASKAKLRQIEAGDKVAQVGPLSTKTGRGHTGGDREASRRTGLSRQDVQRTRKHVEAAGAYPVLQGAGWKRSQVLAAHEALEKIPKRDRTIVVEMIAEPGVDPKSAVTIMETLSEKSAGERREILTLYKSDEPEKQSLAKTRAAKLPPMPDPRYTMTEEVRHLLKRCIRVKKDDLTAAYEFVADETAKIVDELHEAYEKAKRE